MMSENKNTDATKTVKNKYLWRKALKFTGIAIASLLLLLVSVISIAVWLLTPDRLTPIVEKYASQYLAADVSAAKVELTFWDTFPELTVDVDSLRIVSRALDSIPGEIRQDLPADADSLLALNRFHGGINIASLGLGRLTLYDVTLDGIKVNAVQVNDSLANYNILPPSETAGDDTGANTVLPFTEFEINRFSLTNVAPIRYRSIADSTDMEISLKEIAISGDKAPAYMLSVNGNMDNIIPNIPALKTIAFGADGTINWNSGNPLAVSVSDFKMMANFFNATFNAAVDFTGTPVVTSFKAATGPIAVDSILAMMPDSIAPMLSTLKTDMTISAEMELSSPWLIADSVTPSFSASIEIPRCSAELQGQRLNTVAARLTADFDGTDLDASTFSLEQLDIAGSYINVALTAQIKNILSDPWAKGHFKGKINLSKLPQALTALLPASIQGTLEGDADFRLRRSYLTRENFHRILAKGSLNLRDFTASKPGEGSAYMRHASFDFGSNTSFINDSQEKVDSMLTLSLKIDTLAAHATDFELELKGFRAGAGTVNRRASADTTEINPFGMSLAIERIKMDAPADTLHLRMRNALIGGSLRRYNNEARLPHMKLKLIMDGLYFGKALNKVAMLNADMAVDLHKRKLPGDTISAEQKKLRRKARKAAIAAGKLPENALAVNSSYSRLLRRWNFSGTVKAKRGWLVTPAFPLRNRIDNIDLKFNPDSVSLNNLRYKTGQSDFIVNGTVSNLRRALTARRNNTLAIDFSLTSDTINVNEIVKALFAGSSVMQGVDSAMVWDDNARNSDLAAMPADTVSGPLIVPRNIDATLKMRARNILYSDLILDSFKGDLLIYDGAINLRRLNASTDIGSIDVDGLYSSASADSLQFGLGMKISRFRLDRLPSLVPAIDSLLPVMNSFAGTVNADIAVTTDITPKMDIDIPSLRAAIKLEGDSLVLLDADTFKMLSKWLFFKNKKRNMIDHMAVEVSIDDSAVEIYPFMFDIDRYRLGVMGSNDLAMNLNYHISVLKSPMPFKFGINIKGTPDDFKIRLGGAKFKKNMVAERREIAGNTRVNIVRQIDNLFRKGISSARRGRINFSNDAKIARDRNQELMKDLDNEKISAGDSIRFIKEGLIEAPDTTFVNQASTIGN